MGPRDTKQSKTIQWIELEHLVSQEACTSLIAKRILADIRHFRQLKKRQTRLDLKTED